MSATTSADAPPGAGPFPSPTVSRAGHEPGAAAGERVLEWRLRRNCSLAPRQLLGGFGVLCALSLAVGFGLWLAGAPLVMPFTSLELLAVAAAMLAYGRHAGDGERITLSPEWLAVERVCGMRVERMAWRRGRVRVHGASDEGDGLVELSGDGRCVRVGRYLRPEQRRRLVRELRAALREFPEGAAGPGQDTIGN